MHDTNRAGAVGCQQKDSLDPRTVVDSLTTNDGVMINSGKLKTYRYTK